MPALNAASGDSLRPDGSEMLALWGLIPPKCSRDLRIWPAKLSVKDFQKKKKKIFTGCFFNVVMGLLTSFPDNLALLVAPGL